MINFLVFSFTISCQDLEIFSPILHSYTLHACWNLHPRGEVVVMPSTT